MPWDTDPEPDFAPVICGMGPANKTEHEWRVKYDKMVAEVAELLAQPVVIESFRGHPSAVLTMSLLDDGRSANVLADYRFLFRPTGGNRFMMVLEMADRGRHGVCALRLERTGLPRSRMQRFFMRLKVALLNM